MKPKHFLILAAAAVALLILRLFLVGPEQQVRRLLAGWAADASKTGPEAPIVAAGKARGLGRAFTEDAVGEELREGARVEGRDGIVRAIAWVRESWSAAELGFEEVEIRLQGSEAAEVSARVRVEGPAGGSAAEDGTRVRLELRKVGGDWLIARAEAERPSQ